MRRHSLPPPSHNYVCHLSWEYASVCVLKMCFLKHTHWWGEISALSNNENLIIWWMWRIFVPFYFYFSPKLDLKSCNLGFLTVLSLHVLQSQIHIFKKQFFMCTKCIIEDSPKSLVEVWRLNQEPLQSELRRERAFRIPCSVHVALILEEETRARKPVHKRFVFQIHHEPRMNRILFLTKQPTNLKLT